jgi:hypothetical protein
MPQYLNNRTTKHHQELYLSSGYYTGHADFFGEYQGFSQYNTIYDIPEYFVAMQPDVNDFQENIKQFVSAYKGEPKLPRSPKHYCKLAVKGFMLLINYSSSLPNGNDLLKADFSKLSKELEKRKVRTHKEQQLLNGDVDITIFSILVRPQKPTGASIVMSSRLYLPTSMKNSI